MAISQPNQLKFQHLQFQNLEIENFSRTIENIQFAGYIKLHFEDFNEDLFLKNNDKNVL